MGNGPARAPRPRLPMADDVPDMRASHEDRDRAVDALRVAGGDGRLSAEELDTRLERALRCKNSVELNSRPQPSSCSATSRPRSSSSPTTSCSETSGSARPVPRDRSLVTVAILAATYRPDQLNSHLHLARANGLTQDELVETLTHPR
jgi:Domain of unknown function (DUF1707)/Carboxymuconolactone decarboxylase family